MSGGGSNGIGRAKTTAAVGNRVTYSYYTVRSISCPHDFSGHFVRWNPRAELRFAGHVPTTAVTRGLTSPTLIDCCAMKLISIEPKKPSHCRNGFQTRPKGPAVVTLRETLKRENMINMSLYSKDNDENKHS